MQCSEPNEAIVQRRLIDALANAVLFLTDSQTEQLLNFLVVEIGDRGSFGLTQDHLSRLSRLDERTFAALASRQIADVLDDPNATFEGIASRENLTLAAKDG